MAASWLLIYFILFFAPGDVVWQHRGRAGERSELDSVPAMSCLLFFLSSLLPLTPYTCIRQGHMQLFFFFSSFFS
ncbi:hypothetical protein LY78DRAFT_39698 [Colletotrichum sublineola]|nr:hypothetical protein LY78DRAFT_39698 [Colletotrichum sublineola]